MITNIFTFIIVLGGLVFFHELGHFMAARFFGVGIEKFSLGFGPRLFGCQIGITDYRVSAIPLGGYVKMVGDEPDSELDNDMSVLSFANKHVFKKIIIVLAGPFFNMILAGIILFIIFSSSGIFVLKPVIGKVISDMPASRSGLQAGDVIVSLNKKKINNWDEIVKTVSIAKESIIEVGFSRSGQYSTVMIRPSLVKSKNIFGQEVIKYAFGLTASGDVIVEEISYLEAISNSFFKTYDIARLTVLSIVKLFQGELSTKTMGGPIMIAEMAGHHARAGIVDLMFFIALLSINLAVLNCLPIPVLDGGHIAFFTIEALIGRPVNVKFREAAHQVGGLILLLLMVYVFYNDIMRMFSN